MGTHKHTHTHTHTHTHAHTLTHTDTHARDATRVGDMLPLPPAGAVLQEVADAAPVANDVTAALGVCVCVCVCVCLQHLSPTKSLL